MIEVQHLTKHYGPVTAVHDVSFKAERGEILGFLGPNGAGKTRPNGEPATCPKRPRSIRT